MFFLIITTASTRDRGISNGEWKFWFPLFYLLLHVLNNSMLISSKKTVVTNLPFFIFQDEINKTYMGEAVKIIDEYQMILMSIFLGLLEMGKHSIDLLESRRMNLCS